MTKYLPIIFIYFYTQTFFAYGDIVATKHSINWQINLKQSQLKFSIFADNVPFSGEFTEMQGKIIFDQNDLLQSVIDVSVPIRSLDTGNSEANELAFSPEFLDAKKWPKARFVSTSIYLQADKYWVKGELQLNGVSKIINVPIQFEYADQRAILSAKATIKRLNFNIGTGEWRNTQWISDEVKLTFYLILN